jgi:hypothetical protein
MIVFLMMEHTQILRGLLLNDPLGLKGDSETPIPESGRMQ